MMCQKNPSGCLIQEMADGTSKSQREREENVALRSENDVLRAKKKNQCIEDLSRNSCPQCSVGSSWLSAERNRLMLENKHKREEDFLNFGFLHDQGTSEYASMFYILLGFHVWGMSSHLTYDNKALKRVSCCNGI